MDNQIILLVVVGILAFIAIFYGIYRLIRYFGDLSDKLANDEEQK